MQPRVAGKFASRPLADRFWEKVEITEECWLWTGALAGHGRGAMWVNGRNVVAPRISWEIHYGPVPDGKLVLHSCDNPLCVHPDHLFLGTQSDNMLDASAKGRLWTNARKTHCPRGHPYSGDNLHIGKRGRYCRTCRRERQRKT